MPHISVVIPAYQAEAALPKLYERLRATLETITTDFEILLIDDCSGDRTWPVILGLAERDARVKGVRFSRNFGQHHAITAGTDLCDGDWVVIMDCDLQDEPEAIPALYAKARDGYDVVLARRQARKDHLLKRASSWLFYRLFALLTDIKWDQRLGVFRLMSRAAVEQLRLMREQVRFSVGLIDWMGFPTASVDTRHGVRVGGTSTYTVGKLIRLSGSAIIANSDKPLYLAIQLGFVISAGAFASAVIVVVRYFTYGHVLAGWSSVILTVLVLGGIIIGYLGVIGVYLGRVLDETRRRPLYIIRKRVNL